MMTCGYSSLTRLIAMLKSNFDVEDMSCEAIERLKIEVGARFKILLLSGLNGSLCFRDHIFPEGPNGERNENYIYRKYRYIWVRPGANEFIKRLQSHPRVIFGFYSFMKRENVEEVVEMLKQ